MPAREAAPRPRRRPSWSIKLAALLLSTLLCLGLLEVGFRLAGYEAIHDVYSKPEVFWRHDALLGWAHERRARGTYVGPRPFPVAFRAAVRINSLGLRGPEVADLPAGGRRLMVLGDSQVAGFEVADEKTYARLVEERLGTGLAAPVQVVNAGVRGYGTDQAYLYYRERGRALRPGVVVLHHSPNDPEDNVTLHRMRRPFGKPAFALRPDGSLRPVGRPVPEYPFCSEYRADARGGARRVDTARGRAFCWAQTRLADHSALFTFATMRLRRNPRLVRSLYDLGATRGGTARTATTAPSGPAPAPAEGPPPAPDAEAAPAPSGGGEAAGGPRSPEAGEYRNRLTSTLILELAAAVEGDGARFVLLVDHGDLRSLDEQRFASEGVDVVHLDEALGPDPNAVRFPNDGHLNELGHRRVADLLASRLQEVLVR